MLQETETNQRGVQVYRVSSAKEDRPLRRLLSGTQAGMYLGVSATTVRRLYYDGQIPALRFGSKLRYDLSDLDAFIAREKARSG